ncbi:MAG: GNAT family N-acetyltransferase [Gammaproteobacteria bacterium]|nr:GNAT family N-acetyltransferase [Gammaproteobacteria bacterium]NIR84873.1 GNAT family N-acetyltransferase [Gammaproteobacteria bacterium]NIR91722.1 GNAT family N-acetyltransferase [Gammaproteobacteria bacterium]NIU05920.1 GNAT family N-acetyltransferase [Gammaproteobacteria bacterium]NIV52967.1 GNAT family N-acetyltransferase [Gammaproteobacteria bacterium]
MTAHHRPLAPERMGAPHEIDYSQPLEEDFTRLSRDQIPVRSLQEDDVAQLVAIDHRLTARDRSAYYRRRLRESLNESGVRVSLVAELDGHVVGFVMARVDFGEFGRLDPEAVIDTIGVDPDYSRRKVGSALVSQLLENLAALRVERVRTEVNWNTFDLLAFLERCGFSPSQRLVFRRAVP